MENKEPKSKIDLRKLMQKMGLGTNAFAEACGVSSQSMAQFLRPGKALTTSTIYNLANALDIDPRDMFFPTDTADTSQDGLFAQQDEHGQQEEGVKAEGVARAQDAREMMYCPHCGTKFFVVNVPNRE